MARPSHLSVVPSDDHNIESSTEGGRVSEGNRLIAFADEFTTSVRSSDSQHYLAFSEAPHLAIPHEKPDSPAMQELTNRYMLESGKWAAGAAKALASDYFNAQCLRAEATQVSMRSSYVNNTIYLDTCWKSNQVIAIDSSGVRVLPTCSSMFVRSGVSAPLPQLPEKSVSLLRILDYVRISESALPALVACLINSMITSIPQPLMLIQGAAGTGKTTSLRLLMDLIDPTSSIAGGSLSEDERVIRALSKVRRVLVFDNVSYVKGDASDLLAKITTGSELITRALYQNSTPDVLQLKRPVILNGIIDGFSRSDLASRTVAFNLQQVKLGERVSEPELLAKWALELPGIYLGLLEMASYVLKELPNTPTPVTSFRNLDLVKITGIVSRSLGIDGLAHLEKSVAELSQSVLGASAMGQAFTKLVACFRSGSCKHCDYADVRLVDKFGVRLSVDDLRAVLLDHIDPSEHKNIPALNKGFGEALKRLDTDLASVLHLQVTKRRTKDEMTYILEVL